MSGALCDVMAEAQGLTLHLGQENGPVAMPTPATQTSHAAGTSDDNLRALRTAHPHATHLHLHADISIAFILGLELLQIVCDTRAPTTKTTKHIARRPQRPRHSSQWTVPQHQIDMAAMRRPNTEAPQPTQQTTMRGRLPILTAGRRCAC